MISRSPVQTKAEQKPSFSHVPTGFLQPTKRFASNQDECRTLRQPLQRKPARHGEPSEVPPIVHEVLLSPGQPLDSATRPLMESRFGHDFSRVRVHRDARAAESARAVNALAYTVGKDVVFGVGQSGAQTAERRELLAHELTHVVQQTMLPGQPALSSHQLAEREADQNSRRVVGGLPSPVKTPIVNGSLLRQEKKKLKGGSELERGFEKKPEGVTNKFSFTAHLEVPLATGLRFGSLAFLDKLDIKVKGTEEGEEPIPISGSQLSALQAEIALELAKLELSKLTLPANLGELSLGSTLGSSGSLTGKFGEEPGLEGSFAIPASLKAGYKSPTLLPSRLGQLTLGAELGMTGSVTQTLGEEAKFTPEAKGKAGLKATYESPSSRSPYLTLGGMLGEKARLGFGAETTMSSQYVSEEGLTSKLGASATFGLTGTRPGGMQTFIKLKVSGDIDLDLPRGKIDSNTKSYYVGTTTGVAF